MKEVPQPQAVQDRKVIPFRQDGVPFMIYEDNMGLTHLDRDYRQIASPRYVGRRSAELTERVSPGTIIVQAQRNGPDIRTVATDHPHLRVLEADSENAFGEGRGGRRDPDELLARDEHVVIDLAAYRRTRELPHPPQDAA